MKLNKTVYLEDGGTGICTYDTDDLKLAGFWITVFVISALLNLFAIVGNVIVIVACFLQRNKPPLIIYILALAFSDLLYALMSPFYTYRFVLQYWPELLMNFGLVARMSHITILIGNLFSTISSWLVAVLTIDRLILTRWPFRAQRMSTPRRACIAILSIVIACSAINAVWMYDIFEVDVIIFHCNGLWNIPKFVIQPDGSTYTPIRHHPVYKVYVIVSAVLFSFGLPAATMLISNILIVQVFLSKKRIVRGVLEKSNKEKAEQRLTKMIITVSVLYMICNLPDIITRILWKFLPPPVVASNIQPIAHLFLMVNVGANVVVYALFNKHLFDTISGPCLKCLFRHCSKKSIAPELSGSRAELSAISASAAVSNTVQQTI